MVFSISYIAKNVKRKIQYDNAKFTLHNPQNTIHEIRREDWINLLSKEDFP